jgi:putative PEP-CTERM system histidine kinase
MFAAVFIALTSICNLVLVILSIIKRCRIRIIATIFMLSALVFGVAFFGNAAFAAFDIINTVNDFHYFIACLIGSTLLLIELCRFSFKDVQKKGEKNRFNMLADILIWFGRICGLPVIGVALFLPIAMPAVINNDRVFIFNNAGIILLMINFLLAVYLLFSIENKWRFTEGYQKRIGRIFFLGIVPIALFLVVFLIRSMVYKTIIQEYIDFAIVLNGFCYPLLFYSIVTQKLWLERITVSRELIYSSITILFIGSVLIALGLSIYILKLLGITFTHFEWVFWIFTVVFIVVLFFSSSQMRSRISRFINRRFYTLKHDYRQQFFRLHQSYKSFDTIHFPVMDLVDILKYSLYIDKVYIYFLTGKDGNYHLYKERGLAWSEENVIFGDSPLVTMLKSDFIYADCVKVADLKSGSPILDKERSLIGSLGITAFFSIVHQNTLVGILAIKQSPKTKFGSEDIEIIKVYATSIGNVLFTNKLMRERIEHSQFASFTHIASFIIHDIKNQVATLSLLASNAQTNINNPEFQRSMIKTLQNCTTHLENLVAKFSGLPKKEALDLQQIDVNSVVKEAIENLHLNLMPGITLNTSFESTEPISADKNSLFYVLLNIIKNGLEAMSHNGKLDVRTGNIATIPATLKERFRFSESFMASRKIFISIEDSGMGMNREFLDEKLFQPFITSKDKGIGIGLYQSRMLLEKMGGTIVCDSIVGEGTVFCITI